MAPEGEGSFAFEVQTMIDDDGSSRILGIGPALVSTKENVDMLRKLIEENPNSGKDTLSRLAAKEGISRDAAINILNAGEGKDWTVQKGKHNKHSYLLL